MSSSRGGGVHRRRQSGGDSTNTAVLRQQLSIARERRHQEIANLRHRGVATVPRVERLNVPPRFTAVARAGEGQGSAVARGRVVRQQKLRTTIAAKQVHA